MQKTLTTQHIKRLFNSGKFKQVELARLFGLSRQRIRQIIEKNYENFNSKKITDKIKYLTLLKNNFQCQLGIKCTPDYRQPNLHIHHIDLNRLNNKPKNLITLCAKCHRYIHTIIKTNKKDDFQCEICKEIYSKNEKSQKNMNICKNCL